MLSLQQEIFFKYTALQSNKQHVRRQSTIGVWSSTRSTALLYGISIREALGDVQQSLPRPFHLFLALVLFPSY